MIVDIDKLEELAHNATKGLWVWVDDGYSLELRALAANGEVPVLSSSSAMDSTVMASDADKAFLCAVQPTTILLLVERIAELERKLMVAGESKERVLRVLEERKARHRRVQQRERALEAEIEELNQLAMERNR